jgi:hypothetical protein
MKRLLLVAAITAIGAEFFARLKERREKKALLLSLAAEVRMYLDLFMRKRAMLLRHDAWRNMNASELKTFAELPSPIIFSASAGKIGLLGPGIAAGLTEFYAVHEALNFAVRVATRSGMDSRWGQILELARLFEEACKHALALLDKLPHEKADAALKAAIREL